MHILANVPAGLPVAIPSDKGEKNREKEREIGNFRGVHVIPARSKDEVVVIFILMHLFTFNQRVYGAKVGGTAKGEIVIDGKAFLVEMTGKKIETQGVLAKLVLLLYYYDPQQIQIPFCAVPASHFFPCSSIR